MTPRTDARPHPDALTGLLTRAADEGRVQLSDLAAAFSAAGVEPKEGRAILGQLAAAGVTIVSDTTAPVRQTSAPRRRRAAPTVVRRPVRADAQPATAAAPDGTASGGTASDGTASGGTAAGGTARSAQLAAADSAARPQAAAGRPAPAPKRKAVPVAETAEQAVAEEPAVDVFEEAVAGTDLVRAYLNDIGRVRLLDAAQEVELAKRIEAGLYAGEKLRAAGAGETDPLPAGLAGELRALAADGARAKRHLLEANLRLVVSLAKRYTGHGVALLDLIQEGSLGLIRAVEKFDYAKGYKFSTYATWWIRQALQRSMADSGRTIRVPVYVAEQITKLRRIQRELNVTLGRLPTDAEVAAEADLTAEKVAELLSYAQDAVSLDTPVGTDGDAVLGDFIEDAGVPDAVEAAASAELSDQLADVLADLNPQQATVLRLRFGLDGEQHTADQVGRRIGLSRARILEIERDTLQVLRQRAGHLSEWLIA